MRPIHTTALQVLGLLLGLSGPAARADVVAVVSSKSPIVALTTLQIADIFLGRASRFPNGLTAMPIDLRDGSSERDVFYTKVAAKTPAQIKAYWAKIIFTGRGQPPKVVPNDLEVKKYLAANIAAIGYIDEKLLDDTVRRLQ